MTSSFHPNVHAPWQEWSNNETLHVACAYSNPLRWNTRRQLMNDFRHHMRHTPNVKLYVGELAYGDRPFEVTTKDDIQLRTNSILFHKENILNEVIKRFPSDWKYGCYFDADFSMNRHDWALETIHQLQTYDWVQPFSSYTTLSSKIYGGSMPQEIRESFAATYVKNANAVPVNAAVNALGWPQADVKAPVIDGYAPGLGANALRALSSATPGWTPVGATGGAWAFTRKAFEAVGGLLDLCILGHADWFMAFGLANAYAPGMHAAQYHPHYAAAINQWQEKAASLQQNIGYVDAFAVHHFHGSYKNRGYSSRDKILVRYQFDPVADLKKNYQGIWELTGNKPAMRDAIRTYFLHRNEDDPRS